MKEGGDNPSVRCGRQLPLHSSHRNSFSSYSGVAHGLFYEKAILWPFRKNAHASAASGLRKGEPKEGATPQSAAADSSPYILRTDSALRAAPVLRSAYFPKRVHRTLFSKTLDLQPLCGLRKGAEGGGNPSVCCGRQLPLHASAASGLRKGEPKEGATPQSAAADSSPYILRTDSALRAAPVLRSAYFPKRVHRTLFSKTLDLQPLCGLRKGAKEGTTCQSGSCEDENEKGGG